MSGVGVVGSCWPRSGGSSWKITQNIYWNFIYLIEFVKILQASYSKLVSWRIKYYSHIWLWNNLFHHFCHHSRSFHRIFAGCVCIWRSRNSKIFLRNQFPYLKRVILIQAKDLIFSFSLFARFDNHWMFTANISYMHHTTFGNFQGKTFWFRRLGLCNNLFHLTLPCS